ncbi:MAG TPA: ATP-binding cassette domain-containing protein [Clostridiaceae bacterium]|nr:ATP-binding cassette domain-containing protein [Clostridiaceae bacterium]
MAHFKIQNLTFSYPGSEKTALDNISLSIERGQYITICGKSGSGKTTLMRHLKTVLTPHGQRQGNIFFDGESITEVSMREQSAKIGYVMQNPDNQVVADKVWHELAFGLESLGCDQRTMRIRVAEMASYFGIQTWFHKNVSELSGGQKQLLNLASIMAMQPTVLILDEPTSQLDPIAAADFLNTIRKINLELGTTIILSEHRLEEVFPVADRVVVMDQGHIIADEEPRKIGNILQQQKSDMLTALPSPMQIYYKVDSNLPCPLTVREGRSWLSNHFAGKEIKTPKLPDKADYVEPDQPIVEMKEIWFRYEKELPDVLRDLSLMLDKGELRAIVGGNGTGKSTMLKSLCGNIRPYRGKIRINGKKLEKYKPAELFTGCLAMLPQDPQSLFVKKTVREDLLEMLSDRKLTKEEQQIEVDAIAVSCEISDLLSSHPYDLSGGEQQRAALAKVLLCQPQILLLDEPTKGIDSFFKIKLAEILKDLCSKGVTIIMVSHDIEFCAKYADNISMFFDGGVVTTNTVDQFFSQNSFYTTAANRMSRHIFEAAVTNEDVIELCKINK